MGQRLTRIYTRTGDDGTTGLGDGARTDKDGLRLEAIGTVDELNSCIALVLAQPIAEAVAQSLEAVQNDLFDLGGELSVPGNERFDAGYVERLERDLDALNADLPPLKEFILPGGGPAAAACHLARTVCRRAERRLVALRRETPVPATHIAYVNRLSDLLFVAARVLTRADRDEVLWRPGAGRDAT